MSGSYWGWSGEGQDFITYPEFPPMPSSNSMREVSIKDMTGLIPGGEVVTFDFEDGVVERTGIDDDQMGASLDRYNQEYVKSMDIYSDVPVRVRVEDDEGQTPVGFWQQETRVYKLRDVRVKELEVMSDNPATITVVASTDEELGFTTDCGTVDLQRLAVQNGLNVDDTDPNITLDDTPTFLYWMPEVAVHVDDDTVDFSGEDVPIPAGSSPHLYAENDGQYDIAIEAEVSNTRYPWDNQQSWTYLPGWSRDSPKIVSGYDEEFLSLTSGLDTDDFPGNHVKFKAWQTEQDGETSDAYLSLNAKS